MSWGFTEQEAACQRLLDSRGGIAWWKPGAGKTRIGIMWYDGMREIYKNEFPCVVVVILKRSAFLDFRKELIKLDYDCVILEDNLDDLTTQTKIAMLQKPTVLLVSIGMLPQSVDSLLVDPRVKYVIADELHYFKNPKAIRSQALFRLTREKRTCGLSGSIMTKGNPEDVYGQLLAVQKHRLVASSLTEFRTKFMNMKMMERKDGKRYPWRSVKAGAYRQIMEACASAVHVYDPPKNNRKIQVQTLIVPATSEQLKAFDELREWMEIEMPDGSVIEYDNRMEVAMRIQQISNGWVCDDNGVYRTFKSNKPDVMLDKVEEIVAAGDKCIIWCAFREDVKRLDYLLQHSRKIATVQFMSQVPFDQQKWESGTAQVCVATESMGVSVNHFAQVPYAFYFSQNYNWIDLQQSMARTDRHSSTHPTAFYYFMQVEGSLDAEVFANVNSARDWENRLVNIGEALTRWQRKR